MKNSKQILAVLAFLAAVAAGPAAAQDKGIYLGGSGGYVQYKNTCKRALVPCDKDDEAWRVFGGYQFSRNWSAELGYADLGAASGSSATASFQLEVKTWDLSLLGSIPIAGGLSAFGRLGAYRARTTVDQQGPSGPRHDAGTNSGFTYGAGLGYNLWRLGLRAEWQHYEKVGTGIDFVGRDKIDVLSLGGLFRF